MTKLKCIKIFQIPNPYEKINVQGANGLTTATRDTLRGNCR